MTMTEMALPDAPRVKDGIQGTLALAFALPNGLPAEPESPPALRLIPGADTVSPTEPRPAQSGAGRAWASRLACAVVEVLAGERPAAQLLRWTTQEVYDMVARQARQLSRGNEAGGAASRIKPTVRLVRVCEPADGVVEACAVVGKGERFSAVALRLEHLQGGWRCTALEMSWPGDAVASGHSRDTSYGEPS